jgi:hypothetical protein
MLGAGGKEAWSQKEKSLIFKYIYFEPVLLRPSNYTRNLEHSSSQFPVTYLNFLPW